MKKTSILLTLLILLGSASLCQAASWQPVTTITGANDQTTDYFTVPSDEWRITYTITPEDPSTDYASFSAFAYPKGEDKLYVTSLEADAQQTTGTIYVHKGNGQYYLYILAANLKSYTLTIESESTPTAAPTTQLATLQPSTAATQDQGQLLLAIAITAIVTAALTAALTLQFTKRKTGR